MADTHSGISEGYRATQDLPAQGSTARHRLRGRPGWRRPRSRRARGRSPRTIARPSPARAADARLVGAAEALERARQEVRREARRPRRSRAARRAPFAASRSSRDRARAVAERVVDEVAERLLEPEPVADELEAVRALDRRAPTASAPPGGEAPRDRLEQRRDADPSRCAAPVALVGAGEHEQILGEPREAVGLLGGRAQRVLELVRRARPAQRELELGLQQRERRAQLVARVGDEAALARRAPASSRPSIAFSVSPSRRISSSRARERQPPARARRRDRRGLARASPRPAAAPPPRARSPRSEASRSASGPDRRAAATSSPPSASSRSSSEAPTTTSDVRRRREQAHRTPSTARRVRSTRTVRARARRARSRSPAVARARRRVATSRRSAEHLGELSSSIGSPRRTLAPPLASAATARCERLVELLVERVDCRRR